MSLLNIKIDRSDHSKIDPVNIQQAIALTIVSRLQYLH